MRDHQHPGPRLVAADAGWLALTACAQHSQWIAIYVPTGLVVFVLWGSRLYCDLFFCV